MSRRSTFRLLLILGTLLGSAAVPSNCHGQGLLNWLFPLRAQRVAARQAQRAGWNTSFRPATTSYYWGNGVWNGWSQIPATQCGYAPTTAYRTVWSPVPVTSYRVGANGCQTPCTSYSWQARRVPYVAYQPATCAVAAPCAPAATCAPASTCCGATAPCGCGTTVGYGGSGWQTVTTAAPQYAAGFGFRDCNTCAPTSCTTCASPFTTTGTAPTFADQAPTLGASQWAPATSSGSGCAGCEAAQTNYAPSTNALAATEWRPVDATAPATYQSTDSSRGYPPSATEWRPVDDPRQPLQAVPADEAPRLPSQQPPRPGTSPIIEDPATDSDNGSSYRDPYDRSQYSSYQSNRLQNNAGRDYRVDDPRDFERSQYYRSQIAPRNTRREDSRFATDRYDRRGDGWQRDKSDDGSAGEVRDRFQDGSQRLSESDSGWSYDRNERRRPSYDWRSTDTSPNYRPVNPNRRPLLRPMPDPNRDSSDRWQEASTPIQLIGPERTASRISDRWVAMPAQSASADLRPATDSGWHSVRK